MVSGCRTQMAAMMLRAAGLAPAAIARNLSNSTRSSERMLMELLCLDSKSGAGKLGRLKTLV